MYTHTFSETRKGPTLEKKPIQQTLPYRERNDLRDPEERPRRERRGPPCLALSGCRGRPARPTWLLATKKVEDTRQISIQNSC